MNKVLRLGFLVVVCTFLLPAFANAQEDLIGQTISLSPSLVEMRVVPLQSWTTDLRVTNVNTYDIVVYPNVVNFEAAGEDGHGTFQPIQKSETNGQTLAEWITVPSEGILIKKQETGSIPLQVHIPEGAAPGGHYAAILIGTKPPETTEGESMVKTSQFVSSLMFVSVAGDIRENGDVREFRTTKNVVQEPAIDLEMRFENKGNVHIQPQGDIKLFNMWGQERGIIPINQQTHFGNVLPGTVRKFSFTWKGDTAFYDIGRYSAIVTLGYGQQSKQFATSTTYFWVIPYTALGTIILILATLYKIASLLIRRYVASVIELSGVQLPSNHHAANMYRYTKKSEDRTVVIGHYKAMTAPVKRGFIDLGATWKDSMSLVTKLAAVGKFLVVYRLFFFACLFIVVTTLGGLTVWKNLFVHSAPYAVEIKTADSSLKLNDEEVIYNQKHNGKSIASSTIEVPKVRVINASGRPGVGADVRITLETAGYVVSDLSVDVTRTERSTVIVYPVNHQNAALGLAKLLRGALLSALDSKETGDEVTIYVGTDSITNP